MSTSSASDWSHSRSGGGRNDRSSSRREDDGSSNKESSSNRRDSSSGSSSSSDTITSSSASSSSSCSSVTQGSQSSTSRSSVSSATLPSTLSQDELYGIDKIPVDSAAISETAARQEASYGPHLSVLCLNAFLIPPSISWNPYLWAPFWSCRRPRQRAEEIGRLASQFDIACLQEVFGTNLSGLNSWVLPSHSILPETQSASKYSWLGELVDPVRLYANQTGGMWFAWRLTKSSFVRTERQLFGSDSSVPFSNQGITMVELDVSKTFSGKRLVLFGTHFSVLGTNPRKKNLETLEAFVKEHTWKQYLYWLSRQVTGTAGASGGPQAPPSFLADCAMLLLGDFNLDPDRCPQSYRRLCTLGGSAELRDLFVSENNPNYDVQYTRVTQEGRAEKIKKDGTKKLSGNSLFPWEFKGRIDYMFAIDRVYLSPEEVLQLVDRFPPEAILGSEFEDLDIPILKNGSLVVSLDKITCLGMDIIPQKYGTEISDHWPVTARLCLGVPPVKRRHLPRPRRDQLLRGQSLCLDCSYAAASGAKTTATRANLAMEQNLAVNQLAGRRQQLAPEVLSTSEQLIALRNRRAEQKRLLAKVTAKSAKEAAERVQI